jgi:amino acid adenylation domain-containing protein
METKILQNKLNKKLVQFKDNIAVEHSNRSITYAELNKQSNYVANGLIRKGIPPGSLIGVLEENKIRLISLMIGIFRAGCVFVPLDSAYPQERLELMIGLTNTKFIIADKTNMNPWTPMDRGKNKGIECIISDELFAGSQGEWFANTPGIRYSPEDKIYVYFTSGTTGTPKAIVGKNKSLLHFIDWEIDTFGIDETFRFSQFITPVFDAFLRDTLVPLCSGATICIPRDKEVLLDPGKLAAWVDESAITLIHCGPALFRLLTSTPLTKDNFEKLKFILLSGEPINPPHLLNWYNTFNERVQLVNLWGTSETTLAKTYYLIRETDVNRERIPVGKPIRGARVLIIDQDMNLCQPGFLGEVYIRTPFRTIGYLNEPETNRERFIRNPFVDNPNDFLHKTGDLGRFLLDGNLDVTGRTDRQVKLRGIRVELEEIESILTKHPGVKEAVVMKKETPNNNELLCAYITGSEKGVKEYLAGRLPGYMLPSCILKLETIPRGPNGKVDYESLPDPAELNKAGYIAPGNAVEKKLAHIWSEILGLTIEKVGIQDTFFDLGGNSLNLMTLIARIHKAFNVRPALGEIIENITIEKQARIVGSSGPDLYETIEAAEAKEYYVLSSAQKRLYILQQMTPASTAYNIFLTMLLQKKDNIRRLEESFLKLIRQHESLRTSFHMVNDQPVQRIHDAVTFEIEHHWFTPGEEEQPAANGQINGERIIRDFLRPFDLSQPPLLRVGLVRMPGEKYVLLVDMHHIISDLVSQEVLIKDFQAIHNEKAIAPLRIQYKDFSQWQYRGKNASAIKNQKEYWLNKFGDGVSPLIIPTDCPGGQPQKGSEGERVCFEINHELTGKIKQFVEKTQSTLFVFLLAIYGILLSKYTLKEDIVIGTPVAGRPHTDLQNIMGMFVNMLAIRCFPRSNQTFREFYLETRKDVLQDFENQDYQFDQLVLELGLQRESDRNPLVETVFGFYNVNTGRDELPEDLKEEMRNIFPGKEWYYGLEDFESKFDLMFVAFEKGNIINTEFEYRKKIFKIETITRMSRHYLNILEEIVSNPNIHLSEIQMLDEGEENRILKTAGSENDSIQTDDGSLAYSGYDIQEPAADFNFLEE